MIQLLRGVYVPRTARKKSNSNVYHIVLRGINRQVIFNDDEDRKRFIFTLKRYKDKSEYKIFAYCIMSNHVHLLLKAGKEPLETIIRRIAGSFVYWYNSKYERIGNLFQDRFKSEPVEDDNYMLTVMRYIHQNPLKAGMVENIEDYYWSSYNDYQRDNGISDTGFILSIFSKNKKTAIAQFNTFNQKDNKDQCIDIKEPKRKLTDEQLIEMTINNFNIQPAMIKEKCKAEMSLLLRNILLVEGVSTRQLSRVTGISKGVIWRL